MDKAAVRIQERSHRLNLKDETILHPVQLVEKSHSQIHEGMTNLAITNIFGHHMPMRLKMERNILSSFQRLPVLRSDFTGLESITKKDVDIDIEDYLNVPFTSEEMPLTLHTMMEYKLGMKNNVCA